MIEVKFAKISGRRRKYHISTDDDDDKIYQKSLKDYIILRSALLCTSGIFTSTKVAAAAAVNREFTENCSGCYSVQPASASCLLWKIEFASFASMSLEYK